MHDGSYDIAGGGRAPLRGRGADRCRLSITDLWFRAGGRALLSGINLTLGRSGVTVLMGPNGAGKSLLLRLVHGLAAPTSGTVLWGGSPLSEETRRNIALVFQKPALLRRTVAANVDFALAARGVKDRARRRNDLLDTVGLADRPAQPARLLSGGEQQRLALARALATDPCVLLLDEPTASLDPASSLRIEQIIALVAARGVRVILVTHDVGQAHRLADEVVFMSHGQVVELGFADSFFSAPQSERARAFLEGRFVL